MSKYPLVLGLATVVIVLDQVTKWMVRDSFVLYESRPVIEGFFHLTYVRNPGGAFSFLRDVDASIRLPFFIGVASVAVVALLWFVREIEAHQRWMLAALGLVLGGAVGNLIDRIAFGEVVDFLDVFWRDHHWPAFNVADSGISVGMTILVVLTLFSKEPPSAGADGEAANSGTHPN